MQICIKHRGTTAWAIATILFITSLSHFHTTVLAAPEIIAKYSTNIPTIDGSVALGEWDDAIEYTITLESTEDSVRFKHDGTYLYTLLKAKDATTNDFVDAATPHDWAGIDFDRNGDTSTMGSETSPDDVEFANYMIKGGQDWWMKGAGKARSDDVSSGGTNDVVAAYGGSVNGYTFWEFKKALNSSDTAGYDIAMNPDATGYGLNTINTMFAYQQSQPVAKRHSSCSSWYLLSLESTIPPPPPPTVKFGELAKKSAWPEHHHFDQSAEQVRGEDLNNTLYALVKNDSLSDTAVKVQVVFAPYKDGYGWVENVSTPLFELTYAGQEQRLEANFDTSVYGTGKYYITAQIWYDSDCDGTIDKAGEIKTFSFAIVP